MSLAARLNRLAPGLTAKQRALLVIRTYVNQTEQDPEVRRTIPQDQRREFDYYIALLYAANSTLAVLSQALSAMVGALESDFDQFSMLGRVATQLEEDLDETTDAKAVRHWKTRKTITVPTFLRCLEYDLRSSVLEEALRHWQELRALEILWAELAAECDGEDLRLPQLRTQVDDTRARLLTLLTDLSAKQAKQPPEPGETVLSGIRGHVDEAMRLMGFREPE